MKTQSHRVATYVLGLLMFLMSSLAGAHTKHQTQTWPHINPAALPQPASGATAASTPSTGTLLLAGGQYLMNDAGIEWKSRVTSLALGLLVGGLIGGFFSERLRRFRYYFILSCFAIQGVMVSSFGIFTSDLTSTLVGLVIGTVGAWLLLRVKSVAGDADTSLGSAKWADVDELREAGIIADEATERAEHKPEDHGLFLGCFPGVKRHHRLHYLGDRHLITFGPTRSGKNTSVLSPNLLTSRNSAVIMDCKGELAKITALRRGPGDANTPGMNQKVYIVDPFDIAQVPGMKPACFNPIDWINSDPENATENSMLVAESIVPNRDSKDPFWDDEAKSLCSGLMLHVAFSPAEEGQRTLGRVRDIINMGDEQLVPTLVEMTKSPHPVARSTAFRTISKDLKLRSNVLATLQANTHFLDSPAIRASLSRSDLKFEDLKPSPMTVYLVLPADRLDTFGRWLRVLVQQAITVNARNIEERPERPVIFFLDEMGSIGKLGSVERAFGLMAGFGIQLWGFFQDAAQAKRVYGDGWESFVGNAGVLQYFGSRDHTTSDYMSKLCGVATIRKFSVSKVFVKPFQFLAKIAGKTALEPQSITEDNIQRQLAFPDELMRLRHPTQLLFIEGCNPILAKKLAWFDDPARKHLGRNLFKLARAPKKAPKFSVPAGMRVVASTGELVPATESA